MSVLRGAEAGDESDVWVVEVCGAGEINFAEDVYYGEEGCAVVS